MLAEAEFFAGVFVGDVVGEVVVVVGGTTVGATAGADIGVRGVGFVTGIVAGFVTGILPGSPVALVGAAGFVAACSGVEDPAFELSPIVWLAVPGGTGASTAVLVCAPLSVAADVDSTVVPVVVVVSVVSFV